MTDKPEDEERDTSRPTGDSTISFSGITVESLDAPQVGLTTEDLAAIEALPPTSALLIVQRGPNSGSRFLLDAPKTTAGRHVDSDIFLDDVTVSRKHAEFLNDNGAFTVRDIGSLNGTYVNRERIDSAVLRSGDEVQIGKFRLTFHPSPTGPGTKADGATPKSES